MKKLTLILFPLILFISGATYYFLREKIIIAGDPCTVPLAEKLGEAYTAKTGIPVEVRSSACSSGITRAADGEVDIGVSTHEVEMENLPSDVTNRVIARAPTILIANQANPVNNLSREQVRSILRGEIFNWKDVGGSDLDIKNVLLQPCTTHIFTQKVELLGVNLRRYFPDEDSFFFVSDTNRLVEKHPEALGLQIYGYQSDDVKIITIDGRLPDAPELKNRGYSYYQDYNVIVKGEPQGNVKDFIDFALSPAGQAVVKEMKHIRMDEVVPKSALEEL